jgi:hypothetical protein
VGTPEYYANAPATPARTRQNKLVEAYVFLTVN